MSRQRRQRQTVSRADLREVLTICGRDASITEQQWAPELAQMGTRRFIMATSTRLPTLILGVNFTGALRGRRS